MLTQTFPGVPEPELGCLHSEVSPECANTSIPHIDCRQRATDIEQIEHEQFSFRLLCPVSLAGGLIGKNGVVVKAIEDNSGASVDVGGPVRGCMERAITVSAMENPGQKFSKVQDALLRIFDRMQKVESNSNMHSMSNNPLPCSARVLILQAQFGCLVGPSGAIIKDMVKSTRTRIKIFNETGVPACASQYELVLQITGEQSNVRNALSLISEKLRNHVFSSKRTTYSDGHVPSWDIHELTTSSHSEIDSVQNSINAFHLGSPGSPQIQKPANGNGTEINNPLINELQKLVNGNGSGTKNLNTGMQNDNGINISNHEITCLEETKLLRGIKTAIITRITYEIAVCGDNGNNVTKLREISGADISVHYPPSKTSDILMVISGTPEQAQLALAMFLDMVEKAQ
uniref:K Homology domain-containing protein n=1 Tax=Oryza brachyantha TaxID=4533 RepID=J3MKE1_ORYBR